MQPTQRIDRKPVLEGSLELADKAWKVALTDGKRPNPAVFKVDVADLAAGVDTLLRRLDEFKAKWGLPVAGKVILIHEAGQDGFWIARLLDAKGIAVVVVDAASVQVTRHAKRAKTDRLDALKLLEELRAWLRGERRELRVLHIPSEEAEAKRLYTRERGILQKEICQHRDRMRKLLRTQGCRAEIDRTFVQRLTAGDLRRADGRPLPLELQEELTREWARLVQADEQFKAVENTLMHQLPEPMQRCVAVLSQLKGVGWVGAMRLVLELFWRDFTNRRQIGCCVGLVPVPYDSGDSRVDQGISKQGNRRVRALLIEMAWKWLTYQPDSAVAQWFKRRTAGATRRGRRTAIVAVARKLAIALWRFMREGVLPTGAQLKT